MWKRFGKAVIQHIVIIGIFYILFDKDVSSYIFSSVNLEFLRVPFIGSFSIYLVSRIISIVFLKHSLEEERLEDNIDYSNPNIGIIKKLLNLCAIVFGVYTLMSFTPYLIFWQDITIYVIFAILGFGLHYLKKELFRTSRFEPLQNLLSGLAATIIGYSLWHCFLIPSNNISLEPFTIRSNIISHPYLRWMFSAQIEYFEIAISLQNVGTLIFGGFLAVSFAFFFSSLQYFNNKSIFDFYDWLRESQFRNFIIGFLFSFYFVVMRPILVTAFLFTQFLEILIIGIATLRIFLGVRTSIGKQFSSALDTEEWRKHIQQVQYVPDQEFEQLNAMQGSFIQHGVRNSLIVYLVILLEKNDISQKETSLLLHSLVNYKDRNIPRIALGLEKQRIRNKNRKRRERILSKVMTNLNKTFGIPSHLKLTIQSEM